MNTTESDVILLSIEVSPRTDIAKIMKYSKSGSNISAWRLPISKNILGPYMGIKRFKPIIMMVATLLLPTCLSVL